MKNPLFSVVTVCFNAKDTIEETIQSIVNQSDGDFEYIIIDGGSSDGTLDIIDMYRDRIDIFISETDDGIYNAMNKASGIASGKYIIYMNSNDVFSSQSVLKDVNCAIGNRDYNIIYGDYFLRINENRYLVHALPIGKGAIVTSHQAIFCKTSLVYQLRFNENLKLAADYKLVCSLLALGPYLRLKFPVCVMEGVGFSSDKKNQILREYYSINKELYGAIFAWYVFLLAFLSMTISNFLSVTGLGGLRNYLRRVKGWELVK